MANEPTAQQYAALDKATSLTKEQLKRAYQLAVEADTSPVPSEAPHHYLLVTALLQALATNYHASVIDKKE